MQRRTKSGLFLLEMIISITFFALCSAVCVSLFVEAHLTSGRTRELNMAVIAAQTAAESFKAANGIPADVAEILDSGMTGSEVNINYDADWHITKSPSKYRVNIYTDTEASPVRADIVVVNMDTGDIIHSIKVSKYMPQGAK